MPYIAQDDLVPARLSEKELIELTDDDGAGEVNADVVTAAIDRAGATLDSYAGTIYALPLVVSEQIKGLALDLAVYYLFARRRRVPEELQTIYDRAISFLRDVSTGKVSLDQPGKTQTSGTGAATKDHESSPDVFDDNKIGEW